MKSLIANGVFKWSYLLVLAMLVAACGKEQLDPPMCLDQDASKSAPTVLNIDGTTNVPGDPKGEGDGGGGTISDDGDDVGDGERTRKKRSS